MRHHIRLHSLVVFHHSLVLLLEAKRLSRTRREPAESARQKKTASLYYCFKRRRFLARSSNLRAQLVRWGTQAHAFCVQRPCDLAPSAKLRLHVVTRRLQWCDSEKCHGATPFSLTKLWSLTSTSGQQNGPSLSTGPAGMFCSPCSSKQVTSGMTSPPKNRDEALVIFVDSCDTSDHMSYKIFVKTFRRTRRPKGHDESYFLQKNRHTYVS